MLILANLKDFCISFALVESQSSWQLEYKIFIHHAYFLETVTFQCHLCRTISNSSDGEDRNSEEYSKRIFRQKKHVLRWTRAVRYDR